jgi:hypothetical protein
LADFNVLDKKGAKQNIGAGYTGSGGTKSFLFALNPKSGKLASLFDDNVINFVGVVDSSSECPDMVMEFSGNNFVNSKDNSQYGMALASYDSKKKKYQAKRVRWKGLK